MNKRQDKINFSDILLSEEFQLYVNDNNEENLKEIEKILGNNPELYSEYKKAQQVHNVLITSKKQVYSKKLKDNLLKNILTEIELSEKSKNSKVAIFQKPVFKVAAAVILIMGLSLIFGKILFQKPAGANNQMAYNEIIVPSGEKSQVILSDGTKIWLNSESKLRYPSQFTNGKRNVYLEGEAYFDVSKLKKSKFYVHTQGINIEVLGTKFNVKSYPDEETVETSVVEGKVKVESESKIKNLKPVFLLPREKAIFSKKLARLVSSSAKGFLDSPVSSIKAQPLVTISNVNVKNIICWKDQLLVFDNETLEEIAVKMSRWYKIQVHISDSELKAQRFTGKFVNNEMYNQVMEAINLTTPIEYKLEGNKLTIYSRLSDFRKRIRTKN